MANSEEVTNYAIMGDSLYVFDQGRKKIALADLDIPATVQANDDRGMEFKVPPSARTKATTTVPPERAGSESDHERSAQHRAAITP